MVAAALFTGAVLGLSVAAPFGPVALTCIQQSLNLGYRHGVIAGAGAATAHGIFALVAIAGSGAAFAILAPVGDTVRILSALVLLALGVRTLFRARTVALPDRVVRLRASYVSMLALAISNPMTIIPYLAMATAGSDTRLSAWSVPGAMAAAALWYCGLSLAASMLRGGMPSGLVRFLNLAGGCSMIGFGTRLVSPLLSLNM